MTEPTWIRVEVRLPEDEAQADVVEDLLSGLLPDLGAQGVEYLDGPRRLVATFRSPLSPEALGAEVTAATSALELGELPLEARALDEADWAPYFEAAFEPLRFGPLSIVPSWAPRPDGLVLVIDPSQAFGTGLHPTTALCLEWLVANEPQARLLDVGAGTGVLALAAIALGAPSALAVEIDALAVQAARHAAEANNTQDKLHILHGEVTEVDETFEVVLANVRPDPLRAMREPLTARVRPGGALVLCGMRGHEAPEVEQAYLSRGFARVARAERDDWVRLDLQRHR